MIAFLHDAIGGICTALLAQGGPVLLALAVGAVGSLYEGIYMVWHSANHGQ